MYDELLGAWRRELESPDLMDLSADFYSRIADYVKLIGEEGRMLDKRTIKARLLREEVRNVKHMLRQLMMARYKKLMCKVLEGDKITSEVLAAQEEKMMGGLLTLSEVYQTFENNLLHGKLVVAEDQKPAKNIVLRFLKEIPSIVGVDIKSYGPFLAEDVATLPFQNARIMIKQGLAQKIEISQSCAKAKS